jgi:hypothetical protein
MLRDALLSIGAVVTLLVLAVVLSLGFSRTGSLLWFMPTSDRDEILAAGLDPDCMCPTTCEVRVSRLPRAQRDALAADASHSLADHLGRELHTATPEVIINTYTNDQLWWRSREGYRLVVPGARTMVMTVETDADTTRRNSNFNRLGNHPATRNGQIRRAISLTNSYMSDLGFRRSEFNGCPLNIVGDPFNNCVAHFERANIFCSLTVSLDDPTNHDLNDTYRLEMTCSDSYRDYHAAIVPLLDTLTLINPSWFTPDLVTFNFLEEGDFRRIDLGYTVADRHALFVLQDGRYQLIDGGFAAVPCQVANNFGVPTTLVGQCVR